MEEKFGWLQIFAEGAPAAPAEGESGAEDAGARLAALGVPEKQAEKFRRRAAQRQGDDAAWDEFFKDSGHRKRLEQMMAERGRSAAEAKAKADAQLEKLAPTLRLLGERYGLTPAEDGSYDLDAVRHALGGDAGADEPADADAQKQRREQELRAHFERMQRQAEGLRELYPDFDLARELENPDFLRRTAPGPDSMSVEDAFYSIHHGEILRRQAEAIARRARLDAAASIASGSVRPHENGGGAGPAPASLDLRGMSRRDRLAYIRGKYPPV